jgi:carbonic anhydrase
MPGSKRTRGSSGDSDRTAPLDRRAFLVAAGAIGAVVGGGGLGLMAAPGEEHATRPVDARESLARLSEGNRRFVEGKTRWVPVTPADLIELEKGQHPFATVLGCSDSRVPIELIFDQGLGDLFIIRLAGHIVDPHVQGSLEYAFVHLDTKLIVVLGHEGCGAVTAAMAAKEQQDREPIGILHVLEHIEPILEGIDENLPQAEKVHMAVEANVRLSMENILTYPGHREAHQRGAFELVGAVYDMHTGKVRFLDQP